MTYENISAQQAKCRMDADPSVVVLDVRRPDEFALGHIPRAVNVPLADIESGRLPELMEDKTSTYLIYCRSGVRSVAAAELLSRLGYEKLANFGGILTWPYEVEH